MRTLKIQLFQLVDCRNGQVREEYTIESRAQARRAKLQGSDTWTTIRAIWYCPSTDSYCD